MSFKFYNGWTGCHNDHISTLLYIPFIVNLVWTSKEWYHWNHCSSSLKWQWAIADCVFCCITTIILLRRYIVFINLFYIINFWSKTISTGFFAITVKKLSTFFVLERNLFLRFDLFYLSIYQKLLYEYYLPLSTLYLIFFNQHNIYRFHRYNSKEFNSMFFWSKTCSYDSTDFISQST